MAASNPSYPPVTMRSIQVAPALAQILQEAEPSLLAFFGARAPRQHLFVGCRVHSQSGQDDRGIGFFPMANTEMDTIEVEHTEIAFEESTLATHQIVGSGSG